MADREKVIKGLECCLDALVQSEHALAENGVVMSSWQDRAKRIDAIREAIAMLKAQEPVEPTIGGTHGLHGLAWYQCGYCLTAINLYDKYCHECGRAVKWE